MFPKKILPLVLFPILLSGCLSNKKDEPAQASAPSAYPNGPEEQSDSTANSGIQKTYSGLQYEVLRQGTGRRPTMYNRVKVHYKGYFPSGKVFDSSYDRGQPATFGLNQVIAGWTEGIQLMREGAKYRFTVPSNLGYGPAGRPPTIPPNQTLKFDVELIEVVY